MPPSLSQKAYEYLQQKLANGGYEPGTRLVNRTLAEEIGVSVIPVREAIHRLASEGLVEHIPGAGAYVRDANHFDLNNLYVLRDALESCAAAEAAKYITDEQLGELEFILARSWEIAAQVAQQASGHSDLDQLERWMDDEQQFHELLLEASRNPLLAKVAMDNRAICSVFQFQRRDPSLLTSRVARETCESKAELIETLRKRDSQLARQLMSEQIQRGRKTVAAHFNQKKRSMQRN
ncbi:MAG: GntR family transcriptional regulator [Novipirellula sp. JB048]